MSAPRMPVHASVLPAEVVSWLDPQPGETWVDCTVGSGGHTRLLAARVAPTGRVLALDQDPAMLELAQQCSDRSLPITWIHANFDQLSDILITHGIAHVDGVLADLGFCSDQLACAERGFSFRDDGPLDMRLDPTQGTTAAELVNTLSEAALAHVFWEYGEERYSRRVARHIVERRRDKPFTTTGELVELVRRCVPRSGRIDPATRVFQALRIAVNDELGCLERLLAVLPRVVRPGGKVGIISFHSLEDRRVKQAFRTPGVWQPLTKKPVEATAEEIHRNPRARSAKLRVAQRIADV
ncbi:MAG: 16S rRNA (cytosine(1402)-N(4))-methyltransferase RsmH [Gemmataceae bacterium]|nr:16S rRNA (cytosine(1402)-N(4))-methyltransferase RsmH [Gemmata sp.]MDW8198274.1 16S rRNA (cytosine(1402)-N(4))-methyltransferase RsmH [Gemmataceae bacterium]